jgi:hypothetical protein
MRRIFTNMLCAAALCVSTVAIAEPIFASDEDAVMQPIFEQSGPPAAPSLEQVEPRPDYAFLLPGGASIRDTSYFTGMPERQRDTAFEQNDGAQEDGDSSTHPISVVILCFGATLFVFTVDAWGGRRWRRRRRYRFVLYTKPEYQERAVA